MSTNIGKEIAKAYILHTASIDVSREKIHQFKLAYTKLADYADADLFYMVKANVAEAFEEVDPVIDMDVVFRCIANQDKELINFKRTAGTIRKSEFDFIVNAFPMSDVNKRKLKIAVEALGAPAVEPTEPVAEDTPPVDTTPTETPADAPTDTDTDVPQEVPLGSLDSGMQQKVVAKLDEYLKKNVFQSSIVPQITLKAAKKLKADKGFIVDFDMTDNGGQTTVSSSLLLQHGDIVLPVDIFDTEGNRLGDFAPEAIKEQFDYKPEAVAASHGYNKMVTALCDPNLSTQGRSKIIDNIRVAYGSDAAREAFDTYTIILFRKGQNLDVSPIKKINAVEGR